MLKKCGAAAAAELGERSGSARRGCLSFFARRSRRRAWIECRCEALEALLQFARRFERCGQFHQSRMESPGRLKRADQLLQVITKRIRDLGESALQRANRVERARE